MTERGFILVPNTTLSTVNVVNTVKPAKIGEIGEIATFTTSILLAHMYVQYVR